MRTLAEIRDCWGNDLVEFQAIFQLDIIERLDKIIELLEVIKDVEVPK